MKVQQKLLQVSDYGGGPARGPGCRLTADYCKFRLLHSGGGPDQGAGLPAALNDLACEARGGRTCARRARTE